MPAVTAPRLLAALAAVSLCSALFAALPGIAAGDPSLIRQLLSLGAVLPLIIVVPIAAAVLPIYILLRRSGQQNSDDQQFFRSRSLGAWTGGAVGTLLGVCAASNGHIAAPVVAIVAICGAILGYADACWREPPQRPAR